MTNSVQKLAARILKKAARVIDPPHPTKVIWDEYLMWLCFANAGMLEKGNIYSIDYAISHLPSAAPIVEIGSFCGLSANVITHLKRKHGISNPLITCDKWEFEGAERWSKIESLPISCSDFRQFVKDSYVRNIRMFSQDDLPFTFEMTSDELFVAWREQRDCTDILGRHRRLGGPLSFCYIDGNHSYEYAKRDFLNCDSCLEDGGFILFDDSTLDEFTLHKLMPEIAASRRYRLVALNPYHLFQKVEFGTRLGAEVPAAWSVLRIVRRRTMTKLFVSILIDTYNHQRFIEQAIISVLEQDFPMSEAEILVVDDGSTDRTPEIVRKFEPRVRLLRKENGGQASAFNAGIPECRGEIIAFLDGDDWWAPQKLRRVTEAVQSDAEVGIVGHGVIETYADGSQHSEILREPSRFRLDSSQAATAFRVRKNFLGTSRMTLRAKIAPKLLPVPEDLRFEADEYLFTMASACATALILPDPLTFYRMHNSNLFQASGFREEGIRRKQEVLACLGRELDGKLRECGVPGEAVKIVVGAIMAEADQLRLMVDGGYPWETVRAELAMYRFLHSQASLAQWLFKCASLLPAMVLPPRLFYRARRSIAANKFYLRARKSLLPIPQPQHTIRQWKEEA